VWDPDCPGCGGSGREFVERRLKVHIPPGVEDGAQLRVKGEGDAGDRGGAPGDLLLDVRVLAQPRDPSALRVVAFVLCAAAIAILVAYVLLS
jgi:molecular chaperone DnaJ